MYKTILVPLDGSTRAEAILSHVENVAQLRHARVLLLQIVEAITVMPAANVEIKLDEEGFRQHTREAHAYLTSVQKRLQHNGLEVAALVEHGPVVETICNVAAREGADLIAMASHGRSGVARAFYGSVAAGVLHRIDRPLLLIRSRTEE